MNDTVQFLIKVIALSAVLSLLIKLSGQSLSVDDLSVSGLNRIALTLILLPSLIVGSFLALQR